jgi:GT2 family glycosyltransferase/glycosyltransferase involved in cell wall biosynthesis/SAM-dependent methyltransferase
MVIEFSRQENTRKELANKYIRGTGIEIGALQRALEIPPHANVVYVDRLETEELVRHYPELGKQHITPADIIDDAETLGSILNEQYDFCIANHVLEHMRNPVGALLAWLRILKPGGVLYLSVPDIVNPLDTGRKLTGLDHIQRDYDMVQEREDYEHFLEYFKFCHKLASPDEIEKIAHENFERNYSIHYHTFNSQSLEQLFSWLISGNPGLFRILEIHHGIMDGVLEHTYIIEKDTYLEKILTLLKTPVQERIEMGVDVILPVYNAYDDLLRCLFSLLTHNTGYRIILINDNSPDERIGHLFQDLMKYQGDFLILLENPENLGFTKTVNRGMQCYQKDVILLNSDTIVTVGWAGKIKKCACSSPDIATVTPLTNNGTICSVPVFLQDNQLPDGFTVDTFAQMIEEISFNRVIEIPTAVGFCMFIKRNILEEIGYFDAETYGRGYGEENDFSRRAILHGFRNVLCDTTFIYHRGASSFSGEKKDLYEENQKKLSERYPDYREVVARFCSENPLEEIHTNIRLRMGSFDSAEKKTRILILLHNLGGGTQKYVTDMVSALKRHYIFYILQVSGSNVILEEINNGQIIRYAFPMGHSIDVAKRYDQGYKKTVEQIIGSFRINLIHVHHLFGHTLDIFNIAKELQIPLLMTIHDYYIICPSIFPVNEERKYCADLHDRKRCNRCISAKHKKPEGYINEWRDHFRRAITNVDIFVSNDQAVMDIISACHNIPQNKIKIIEPGHSEELIEISKHHNVRNLHDPVCFAYIGFLERSHKGMDMFYSLAASQRLNRKTRWKLIGVSETHKEPGLYPECNIEVYGRFNDYEDLSHALEDVDIVIHPGPAETYSYSLSEAWANGLPVLAADTGVPKARIERTGGGWVMDVCDLEKAEDRILDIITSESGYQQKIANVKKIELNTMENFYEEYKKLYDSYQPRVTQKFSPHFSNEEIFRAIISSENPEPPAIVTSEAVHHRFIKCFREHGVRYTTQRLIVFFRNRIQ